MTMPNRIVIAGAGGQVGRFLADQFTAAGRDLLACTSTQWDITDPAAAGSSNRVTSWSTAPR